MTIASKQSRRFRPRFSLRTLAIIVTLVCAYFGSWESTKRCGVKYPAFQDCPAPFVVATNTRLVWRMETRSYDLWAFGLTARLPFRSERPMADDEVQTWIDDLYKPV